MSAWRNDYIRVNKYTRPGDKLTEVRKIVIHYTANPGASAANHQRYFNGTAIENKTSASAHLFVDSKEAICIVPIDEVAYHANDVRKRNADGTPYRGVAALKPNANFLSVGVELCIEKDGSFHPATIDLGVDVVSELCKRFGLDECDLVRHYDVTAKDCPSPWVRKPAKFEAFKKRVGERLKGATATETTPTPDAEGIGIATFTTDWGVNGYDKPNGSYVRKFHGGTFIAYAHQDGFYGLGGNVWVPEQFIEFKRHLAEIFVNGGVNTYNSPNKDDYKGVINGPIAFNFYGKKDGFVAIGANTWVPEEFVRIKKR